MWAVYAGLSALFASLTAILGKIGVQGINSNLATAIRTIFVLVMAWGMVFITGAQAGHEGHRRQKPCVPHALRPCHRGKLAVLL